MQPDAIKDGQSSRFINTGHIGANTILIKADELRNGYDPVADYARQTALPTTSPFALDLNVNGGQLIAESGMELEGRHLVNTGYLASGGLLAIAAQSLDNAKRNAPYREDRAVAGGTLHLRGDTVQPGGEMAAAEWAVAVQSLHSRSGDFFVLKDSADAAREASSAFTAALQAQLGASAVFETEPALVFGQREPCPPCPPEGRLAATNQSSRMTRNDCGLLLVQH